MMRRQSHSQRNGDTEARRLELIEEAMRKLAAQPDADVNLLARLDSIRSRARSSRRNAA